MGTSWSATALIGVAVPIEKLTAQNDERGCSHEPFGWERNKFCSECGKPIWTSRRAFIEALQRPVDDYCLEGLSVIFSANDEDHPHYGMAFAFLEEYRVQIRYNDRNDFNHEMTPLIPSDDYKDLLRRKLQPLGLWSDSAFGLWSIIHSS